MVVCIPKYLRAWAFTHGQSPWPPAESRWVAPSDQPKIDPYLRRVDELGFSTRTTNCMSNANIHFVGELIQWTEVELLKTKNFGRKSLMEVKEVLLDEFNPPLWLGTKVSDELRALLEQRKRELIARANENWK
ncbi:hypothetical protein EPN81_03515 [Patescibacteria group bacterium]|nr:MAG: hypothetical protein EPN81_03515 [Patescibacteria group bacterium]